MCILEWPTLIDFYCDSLPSIQIHGGEVKANLNAEDADDTIHPSLLIVLARV
jgi:hypothetical protein